MFRHNFYLWRKTKTKKLKPLHQKVLPDSGATCTVISKGMSLQDEDRETERQQDSDTEGQKDKLW